MIKKSNGSFLYFVDKMAHTFEIAIAFVLLMIIAVRSVEVLTEMLGKPLTLMTMDFDRVMSTTFSLVIGIEFTKMLYKHTPETVIDVLLFATARQTVIYHENMTDMLIGVVAISGLFAARKFFASSKFSLELKPDNPENAKPPDDP
jgi:hypothetical protein